MTGGRKKSYYIGSPFPLNMEHFEQYIMQKKSTFYVFKYTVSENIIDHEMYWPQI